MKRNNFLHRILILLTIMLVAFFVFQSVSTPVKATDSPNSNQQGFNQITNFGRYDSVDEFVQLNTIQGDPFFYFLKPGDTITLRAPASPTHIEFFIRNRDLYSAYSLSVSANGKTWEELTIAPPRNHISEQDPDGDLEVYWYVSNDVQLQGYYLLKAVAHGKKDSTTITPILINYGQNYFEPQEIADSFCGCESMEVLPQEGQVVDAKGDLAFAPHERAPVPGAKSSSKTLGPSVGKDIRKGAEGDARVGFNQQVYANLQQGSDSSACLTEQFIKSHLIAIKNNEQSIKKYKVTIVYKNGQSEVGYMTDAEIVGKKAEKGVADVIKNDIDSDRWAQDGYNYPLAEVVDNEGYLTFVRGDTFISWVDSVDLSIGGSYISAEKIAKFMAKVNGIGKEASSCKCEWDVYISVNRENPNEPTGEAHIGNIKCG
ncbi:hypothetical protein HYT58_00710 [Candidatus Woesearchaeota archaeon]|nr:hypothetical protein [Candidatus Woesearchaeota archaeon]